MTERSRLLTDWLLLAGFCGFLFFFGLAHFGLVGADEPRYAQIAREMLVRHDWITPTLDGRPWLEKPALYYWQAMLAYHIFGVSDSAARLPSAIDATLMIFAVYYFLRRLRPGFELDGALMTASLAGVIGFARAASMDMPLSAAFTIALLAWFAWYESGSKRFLTLFFAFLGLGMLAKGPVAPVLGAMCVGAAAMEVARAWWQRRAISSTKSLNIFLVIWILIPVIFFSMSQSKLPGYILPALPAGALLVAEYARTRIAENARSDILLTSLHSIVASLPLALAMMLPFILFQHRIPWNRWAAVSFAFAAVLAIGIALTLRAPAGLRMLRLVTLVPVVLAVAAILRLGAASLDATLSARPLAEQITKADNRRLPLAVLLTSRETEYGLQFYRNQTIARYELGQVPSSEHVVIAPEGLRGGVEKRAAGRRVTYLGSFAAQGLDYYWVGAAVSSGSR